MAHQHQHRAGKPDAHEFKQGRKPDEVEIQAAAATAASDHPARSSPARGNGAPGAIGPHDPGQQPGGRVDGGSAADARAIDFDDDEIYSGRGKGAARGGTTQARGGDSAPLGTPAEQLSDRNGPSDRGGRR